MACHPNTPAPTDVFTVPMNKSHSSLMLVPKATLEVNRSGASAGSHSMTMPIRQNPIAFGHFMFGEGLRDLA